MKERVLVTGNYIGAGAATETIELPYLSIGIEPQLKRECLIEASKGSGIVSS